MTPVSGRDHVLFAGLSFLVTCLGSLLSAWVLDPAIGIDDANITHVYARNIAAGLGYVYNPGGEWVEGSTSLLWTWLNVAAFWILDRPEVMLSTLTFCLSWGIIRVSMQAAHELAAKPGRAAPVMTALAFLAFPGVFAWTVWTLMDVTLWVFLITLMLWVLLHLSYRPAQKKLLLALVLVSALLPLARPEGIVLIPALAGFYVARRLIWQTGSLIVGPLIVVAGLATFVAVTLWRMLIFGVPFPNTFYAKSSTALSGQIERGLRYVLSYFDEPQNILFVVFYCVAGALIYLRTSSSRLRWYFALTLYLIVGGAALYAVLGGDHFGSHRFFLYFLPLGLPLIAAAFADLFDAVAPRPVAAAACLALAFLSVGGASVIRFIQTTGNLSIEFALAREGRELGTRLNVLPGEPSIGVIAAGGIRMTYAHEVRDLLGLNWVAMAHAPDNNLIAPYPGQTGFKPDVFWQAPPDVIPVFPGPGSCPDQWQPLVGFWDIVTDYETHNAVFKERFAHYCDGNDQLYIRRAYEARVGVAALPFDKLAED